MKISILDQLEAGKVKTVRIKSVNSDDALLERDRKQKLFDEERKTEEAKIRQEKIKEKGWKQSQSKGEVLYAAQNLFR